MLTEEQTERLTRVGSGTPLGELMRRYWQPIAPYSELFQNPTKAIRLLGEDLVLYKDRSGTLGLVEASCAHRRVHLLYGIPEDNGLRCPYHGWLYDETGQCLEMPAEAPESTFPSRVQLKAYPVEELGGLVWAYLGPQPTPLLPRWEEFVREGVIRDIGWAIVPCNWVQIMENSLDPVHREYLHRYYANYVLERLGHLEDRGDLKGERPFKPVEGANFWRRGVKPQHHVKIGFSRYEHGMLKHGLLEGEDPETAPDWLVGHPIIFPNIQGGGADPSTGSMHQIRVPIDDTHTYYLWYSSRIPQEGEDREQQAEDIPVYRVPLPGVDEDGHPMWEQLDANSGQDNMAWTSQGPITQRWLEHLGQSDVGLIMFRRILFEQIDIVEDGGEPMNVFRDPSKNERIVLPKYELVGKSKADRPADSYGASKNQGVWDQAWGGAARYSPLMRQRAARQGKADAAPESVPAPAQNIADVAPG